jgi:polyphosphate kinase
VHVVYGVIGLKTHTKITLVVRKEKDLLKTYCHIGTGNYNSKTASLYTDIGILSSNRELGEDLVELFNGLTGYSKQTDYRKLLVAPLILRRSMEALIQRETEHARAGRSAAIKAKMNALVDPRIIGLLYEASQAGVQIDLVVRGMCSLRPGLAGVSDNIRVCSVIGRFLEHSRLFWFANGGDDEIYIGSADWMARNLDRRVEAVTPIEDPQLHQQLLRLIDTYLQDNSTAWDMQPDGSFIPRIPEDDSFAVQASLIDGWRKRLPAEARQL